MDEEAFSTILKVYGATHELIPWHGPPAYLHAIRWRGYTMAHVRTETTAINDGDRQYLIERLIDSLHKFKKYHGQ